MKISATILLISFFSFFSYASPGDVECAGKLNGEDVALLMGFDHHGETSPSLIEVQYKRNVVFKSDEVKEIILNVGTDDQPFHNTAWVANHKSDTVVVRMPEQDPEGNTYGVYLSVSTEDKTVFENQDEIEMTCDK